MLHQRRRNKVCGDNRWRRKVCGVASVLDARFLNKGGLASGGPIKGEDLDLVISTLILNTNCDA